MLDGIPLDTSTIAYPVSALRGMTVENASPRTVEFRAADNFGAFGIPLKNLNLRPGVLIGCIIRGNRVIFPHGDNTIELRDRVIVIAAQQALADLRDILAP